MPTVSTGGTPLAAILPHAATAARQLAVADGRFEALMAPITAELGKGGSKPEALIAQDGVVVPDNQPADQAKAVIPPVVIPPVEAAETNLPRTTGDGAKPKPTRVVLGSDKTDQIAEPAVPAPAKPLETSLREIVRPGSVPVDPELATTANTVTKQNPPVSPFDPVSPSDKQPVTALDEATPQADNRAPATAASNTTGIPARTAGMIAVTEAPPKPSAPVVPLSEPTDPSSIIVPEAMPAEVSPETHAPARPHMVTASTSAVIGTTSVAPVTSGRHAPVVPPQLNNGTVTIPVIKPATSVAHIPSKPQQEAVNSPPVTTIGTLAVAPPAPHVAATTPPDTAIMTTAAAVAQAPAIPQPRAGNASAITSAGTVAAVTADAPRPPMDPTNPPPSVNSASPVEVPMLPVVNSIIAATAPQSQPRDTRSDPVTSPLYTAGVAPPTAPSDATVAPPSVPGMLPTSTASQQVAVHIAQSLNDGGKTVTVELHPAELGRVEIHFSFHSDGTNVRMTVDRPETFDALSHDRNGLQQQLAQAGVDLGAGGLDLRLGQPPPDPSAGYSSGRISRVAMPAQPEATPATMWVSNSLLDILA